MVPTEREPVIWFRPPRYWGDSQNVRQEGYGGRVVYDLAGFLIENIHAQLSARKYAPGIMRDFAMRCGPKSPYHYLSSPVAPEDIIPGDRFGYLTVWDTFVKSGRAIVRCDCGRIKEADLEKLSYGFPLSCGNACMCWERAAAA